VERLTRDYNYLSTVLKALCNPEEGKIAQMKTEILNLSTAKGATTAVVARPDTDSAAAVILIHEWWGINDHIRDITGRYAKEGFICMAPDLYRGKTAQDQQEASKLMQDLAIEDGLETISAVIEETKRTFNVERIGITGYCMGGTFALRAACDFDQLGAAAAFYGDTPEENLLEKLKVPTLFIAGSRDAWINSEKVDALKEAARKNNLPLEVITYDADHAFFNDTRPEVYNPEAAADAWQRVLAHFRKHLGAIAKPTGA
jgi:carboxymethylenebutenolidase